LRELQSIIRRMAKAGDLDVIMVPRRDGSLARCLRLAEFRPAESEDFDTSLQEARSLGAEPAWSTAAPRDAAEFEQDDEDAEEEPANNEQGSDSFAEPSGEYKLSSDKVPPIGVQHFEFDLGTFAHPPQFSTIIPLEYQLLNQIRASGTEGMTYAVSSALQKSSCTSLSSSWTTCRTQSISEKLANMDGKTIEAITQRSEYAEYTPDQLLDGAVKIEMEMFGRERRLRAFTVPNYKRRAAEFDLQVGDDFPSEERLSRAGQWMEIGIDELYASTQSYRRHVATFPFNSSVQAVTAWRSGDIKERKKSTKRRRTFKVRPKPDTEAASPQLDSGEVVKGRPRKYIKLLGLDGHLIRRKKTLEIPTHPELPQIMLYNESTKVFFDIPPGYSGAGPIEQPSDWDTKTSPKTVVVPSTGRAPTVSKKETKGRKRKQHVLEGDGENAGPAAPKVAQPTQGGPSPTTALLPEANEAPPKKKVRGPGRKQLAAAAAAAAAAASSAITPAVVEGESTASPDTPLQHASPTPPQEQASLVQPEAVQTSTSPQSPAEPVFGGGLDAPQEGIVVESVHLPPLHPYIPAKRKATTPLPSEQAFVEPFGDTESLDEVDQVDRPRKKRTLAVPVKRSEHESDRMAVEATAI
jgi:hypothetical protein